MSSVSSILCDKDFVSYVYDRFGPVEITTNVDNRIDGHLIREDGVVYKGAYRPRDYVPEFNIPRVGFSWLCKVLRLYKLQVEVNTLSNIVSLSSPYFSEP